MYKETRGEIIALGITDTMTVWKINSFSQNMAQPDTTRLNYLTGKRSILLRERKKKLGGKCKAYFHYLCCFAFFFLTWPAALAFLANPKKFFDISIDSSGLLLHINHLSFYRIDYLEFNSFFLFFISLPSSLPIRFIPRHQHFHSSDY